VEENGGKKKKESKIKGAKKFKKAERENAEKLKA
jgi:hypothetical protein